MSDYKDMYYGLYGRVREAFNILQTMHALDDTCTMRGMKGNGPGATCKACRAQIALRDHTSGPGLPREFTPTGTDEQPSRKTT